VLLVDRDVQRAALTAVDGVHLRAVLQQQRHHFRLITAIHSSSSTSFASAIRIRRRICDKIK